MAPHEALFGNLFGVRKSVRYHQRRRAFFEAIHTGIAALQLVAGSSADAHVPTYPIDLARQWVGHFIDIEVAGILENPKQARRPDLSPGGA